MNKSILIIKSIDELLSDLGKIPEPIFGMINPKSDLSTRYTKALRNRRKKRKNK